MAGKKKLQIGEAEFDTKRQALDHVRAMLKRLGEGAEVRDGHPDFAFLKALFDRHHEKDEKYGPGLAGYRIARDMNGNLYARVLRVDGKDVDISFVTAVKGEGRTPRQNLEAAMRQAIVQQIGAERARTDLSRACSLCGETLASRPIHIDHESPTFTELVEQFLQACGLLVPLKFDDSPEHRNAAVFRVVDAEFKAAWQLFHEKKANLRAVHEDCNLKRKRNKSK